MHGHTAVIMRIKIMRGQSLAPVSNSYNVIAVYTSFMCQMKMAA